MGSTRWTRSGSDWLTEMKWARKETEIVKKQSNGTRKIGNLIAERGGEAVGDEEGTMGERENGARKSIYVGPP